MRIAAQVLFHARSCPERPALAHAGGIVTYGMVGRGVVTASTRLRQADVPAGGIVAIEVRNPFQHVALILAAELCGLTSVSLTTRYELAESRLRVDALIVDGNGAVDAATRTIQVDDSWFTLAPRIEIPSGGLGEDQFHRIILSSGTTGRPKAIGYTSALLGRFMQRQCLMRGESAPRNLSMIGLSTLGVLNPLFALVQGGFACFASSTEEVLWLIRAFGIARLGFTTAVQLEALVKAARKSPDAFPSLQVIHVSGSRLPKDLADEARARLCGNIITSYASTETGILSYARVGAPNEPDGSAGYVLPWVEIEARDENGERLPPGKAGRLHVKTPDMATYVHAADNPSPLDDGWFRTDDVGTVRADGLLVIEGRTADIINRGGNIVAPDYIEAVLARLPGVKEAAVFAHTAQTGLDEIWAAIVPSGLISKAQIIEACRPLLGDKTPDVLEMVQSLPRTETGKLKRNELRRRFDAGA